MTFEKDPGDQNSNTRYLIRPAGWLARFAIVDVGRHRCGHIEDGISLDLGDCERPNKSRWYPGGIIAFKDLEAIYLAAKAARTQAGD